MHTKNVVTASILLMLAALAVLVLLPAPASAPTSIGPGDGDGQRTGLVETARMFEATTTYYPTGEEYVQAVYASQGITISTDLDADSYSIDDAAPGDIVVGDGFTGILVGYSTAVVVPDDGGVAYAVVVTKEDTRRVDW